MKIFKLSLIKSTILFLTIAILTTAANGNSKWSMLDLPDTGQTGNFTATFGEDSDYTINPPSYTDNNDGTISDNITGLMWQQVDGGEMTYDSATNYSATLSLGEHKDWRVPNSHELFCIFDHGAIHPSYNTTYFTADDAVLWWAINERVDDSSRVWVANSGGGIGPHSKDETISAGGTRSFQIRCVRNTSLTPGGGADHNFSNNGDGTIMDNNTGLIWQQVGPALPMTWETGLAYADSLLLAGYDDWRMPNIKELRSINDDLLFNPSVDTTYFTGATADLYWSSTSEANDSARAWTVDFDYGLVSYNDKVNSNYVRVVRNIPEPGIVIGYLLTVIGIFFATRK